MTNITARRRHLHDATTYPPLALNIMTRHYTLPLLVRIIRLVRDTDALQPRAHGWIVIFGTVNVTTRLDAIAVRQITTARLYTHCRTICALYLMLCFDARFNKRLCQRTTNCCRRCGWHRSGDGNHALASQLYRNDHGAVCRWPAVALHCTTTTRTRAINAVASRTNAPCVAWRGARRAKATRARHCIRAATVSRRRTATLLRRC